MKKMYKYLIPCLAVAFSFIGCADDDVTNSMVELPCTVTMENLVAARYNAVSATMNVSNPENVLEQGLELSTSQDFKKNIITVADSITSQIDIVCAVAPATTYYVRAYAFLKNGKTMFSNVAEVTTPEYIFPITGTYAVNSIFVMEWDNYTFAEQIGTADYPPYEFTVTQMEGEDEGVVEITGLYPDCEQPLQGFYEEEEGLLYIPGGQVIAENLWGQYGETTFYAFNEDLGGEEYCVMQFDKKNGTLRSSIFGLRVSAGFVDIVYIGARQK